MHHYVRDWMKTPIIVVDADSSVSHALTLMRRRGIHSLIVDLNPDQRGYGIITSTDIRDKIIAPNRNPAETTVRSISTAPVITAHPDWTLIQCSQTMQSNNFHHLPVADDTGNLVGMISATDLFVAAEEIGWGKE
jgi:CBS domain-containing protein